MGGDVERKDNRTAFVKFYDGLWSIFEVPVDWFRKSIVEPNQKQYPWYHQKFRRVPTVDECYDDDLVCKYEADQQFKRDRMVDSEILQILRERYEDCVIYEGVEHEKKCEPLFQLYQEAANNWFIKYGDLGVIATAEACYYKHKHRMAWERRHGAVGTGMVGNRPPGYEEKSASE